MTHLFSFFGIILLSFSLFGQSSSLVNFKAGNYSLTKGDIALCGEGEFWIFDETKYLLLDALHGFSIKKNETKEPSDIPEEAGCNYIGKNDVLTNIDKTNLTLTSQLICKNKVQYTLTKTAEISFSKITMQVEQVGKNPTKYECEWAFKSNREVNSEKLKNK